jgi:hypothetical protein
MLSAFVMNPEGRSRTMAKKRKTAKKSVARKTARKAGKARRSNPDRKLLTARKGKRGKARRRNPDGTWGKIKAGLAVIGGGLGGAIVASLAYPLMVPAIGQLGSGLVCTAGGLALAGIQPLQREAAIGAGAVMGLVGVATGLSALKVGKPGDTVSLSQFAGAPPVAPAVEGGAAPAEVTSAPRLKLLSGDATTDDARTKLAGLIAKGRNLRGVRVPRVG